MQQRLEGYRRALANRRFRWLLLAVAALAIVPDFVWNTVVGPLLSPEDRYTDFKTFQQAAGRLAHGVDPYLDFVTRPPDDPIRNGTYVYPPFFAWLLQPVATWTGVERALFVISADLVFLAVALCAVLAALRVRDRQAWFLAALLFTGFFPVVDNFFWGQVSLLLLALQALWFLAYVRGRSWGAAALGVAVAVKLIQAPLLLAHLARRQWSGLALAAASAAAVLLLGVRWLPEWATQVFPAVSGGTGWMGNIAPTGVLLRIADPGSFTSHTWVTVAPVKVAATLIALAVLAGDWLVVRRLPEGPDRRAVEAAVLVAGLPLISPLTWGGHLALQLVPFLVVGWVSIRTRRWLPLALAAGSVLLTGPVNAGYWRLASSGALSYSMWAQPLADLPALGVVLGWLAAVGAAHALSVGREDAGYPAERAVPGSASAAAFTAPR